MFKILNGGFFCRWKGPGHLMEEPFTNGKRIRTIDGSFPKCKISRADACSLYVRVFDWPIKMIGQGGLLLVVSYLFAVPVLMIWVGVEKVNN